MGLHGYNPQEKGFCYIATLLQSPKKWVSEKKSPLLHCYFATIVLVRKKTSLLHCYIATLLQSSRKKGFATLLHCYNLQKKGSPKKRTPATLLLCYSSSCLKKNLPATLL